MAFLQWLLQGIIQALFGAATDYLKAKQADANLKALGYSEAERDLAKSQLKARDSVIEAQVRMAAVQALDRAATLERLSRGSF